VVPAFSWKAVQRRPPAREGLARPSAARGRQGGWRVPSAKPTLPGFPFQPTRWPALACDSRKCACVDENTKAMHGHAVEPHADDAEDDVGELWGRLEQQPPLKGSRGDFDEGALRDESQRSGHTFLSARGRGVACASPENSGTTPGHHPRHHPRGSLVPIVLCRHPTFLLVTRCSLLLSSGTSYVLGSRQQPR